MEKNLLLFLGCSSRGN